MFPKLSFNPKEDRQGALEPWSICWAHEQEMTALCYNYVSCHKLTLTCHFNWPVKEVNKGITPSLVV